MAALMEIFLTDVNKYLWNLKVQGAPTALPGRWKRRLQPLGAFYNGKGETSSVLGGRLASFIGKPHDH